jgi:hypothetical protein
MMKVLRDNAAQLGIAGDAIKIVRGSETNIPDSLT